MIETLLHTTEYNNLYLYDDQTRLSILLHPEFKKAYENSSDPDSYYSKKYEYLKLRGFFSRPKTISFEPMTEERVKQSMFQTPRIVFEVTDSCNLQCKYCVFGELYKGFESRNHQNINIEDAKKLLKLIFDYGNSKLFVSFYGGEPLLNMAFIKQIVEYINELNVREKTEIAYSMTTNATLVHKYIDFFVANKFFLVFSLDGNEENHSYRIFKNKKNSFAKIIQNIDMIQRDYPEYFTSHISFNTVLHDRNSVKDIYEFIYTRYHKIPGINQLAFDDVKPGKWDIVKRMYNSRKNSEEEYQKDKSNLLPVIQSGVSIELGGFLDDYSINFYVSNMIALLRDEEKYYPTSTCIPFSKEIYLTNRSKILFCETIDYKYSTGSMDKNVNINIPGIVQLYNYYYEHLKKVCQCCYAYRYCGKCMFGFTNLDKVDTEGFVCDRFQDKNHFQNKLHRIFSFLEKYPADFSHRIKNKFSEG